MTLPDSSTNSLETGVFVFSWDFELAWGFHHLSKIPDQLVTNNSREYINRIINCLERTGIPSTWATVGHLFLEDCTRTKDGIHPEVPHPSENWYQNDPGTDVEDAPLWYAPDVVQRLQNCSSRQELACHTFSHITTTESSHIIRSELKLSQEVPPPGVELSSFVSPRHHNVPSEILADLSFQCYRIPTTPSSLKRVAKFYSGVVPPSTGIPKRDEHGIWRIPTSTYFFYEPLNYIQKKIPDIKKRWFKSGIERAAQNNEVFHVWAHPHNFIGDDHAINQFEWLLEYVEQISKKNLIQPMTMNKLAERMAN